MPKLVRSPPRRVPVVMVTIHSQELGLSVRYVTCRVLSTYHELIRAGLVLQVLPDDAGSSLGRYFRRYLKLLSSQEIDRRRRAFAAGNFTRVHPDKWLTYMGGLQEVQHLGLATAVDYTPSGDWIFSALMAGLEPSPQGISNADRIHMWIQGELRAVEVRTHLIERLLPVPDQVVPVDKLVEFRRRHGNLLPGLRRYIESKIDEASAITDPILRFRFIDRIEDELLQRSEEAEAYLNEQRFERISRSSLLRVLKFIPGLQDPIENTQDIGENLRTSQGFEAEPLAYLAFARVAFGPPTQTYRVDPGTGMPLVEAFAEPR
jgi:hypothetical protein